MMETISARGAEIGASTGWLADQIGVSRDTARRILAGSSTTVELAEATIEAMGGRVTVKWSKWDGKADLRGR